MLERDAARMARYEAEIAERIRLREVKERNAERQKRMDGLYEKNMQVIDQMMGMKSPAARELLAKFLRKNNDEIARLMKEME